MEILKIGSGQNWIINFNAFTTLGMLTVIIPLFLLLVFKSNSQSDTQNNQ